MVTAEIQWEVSSRQFLPHSPSSLPGVTSDPISKTLNKNRNLTFHGLA
jgi:hypothetical protein